MSRLSLERLVGLYDAWDKKDEANEWRKKLEEAKAAGAAFADVRLMVGHVFEMQARSDSRIDILTLRTVTTVGVRAVIDGVVGFAGDVLSPDKDSMAGLGAGVTGPPGRGGAAASCARPVSGPPTAAAPASVAPLSKPRRLSLEMLLVLDMNGSVCCQV